MKVKDFISKLKHIESLPTTYYSVAGGDWAKWNGWSWNFDCVVLVKAILWGWNGNKNSSHGGANYGSNGVYDDGTEQIISRCKEVSTNFSNIKPGELLWMPGHVGVYVGNGNVIECTAAWEGKVLYSKIDSNGARSRNGKYVYAWKKHGKLPYVDYTEEPAPAPAPVEKSVEELAREVIDGKWGNGEERKQKLGNRYAEVQARVNEILAPKPKTLSVGDKVRIIGYGNGSSYGDSNKAGGIGWDREILKIHEGRQFPYQVGNSTGTTGFYQAEALERI